ncbi:MAG: extracellular solute-binding protein [Defluviitaleaceae bacterium]|nr:extracellular solute-binding protein [Defluviitaleaceae bacterium]
MKEGRIYTKLLRAVAFLLCSILLASYITVPSNAAEEDSGYFTVPEFDILAPPPGVMGFESGGFYDYFFRHQDKPMGNERIELFAPEDMLVEGRYGTVIDTYLEWEIEVAESGRFHILINYFPLPGTGRDIEMRLYHNGEISYNELRVFQLPRIWVDERNESGTFVTDSIGNDIRPPQIERPRWVERWVSDSMGLFADPFFLYLEAGKHTIRIVSVREQAVVHSVVLAAKPAPPTHAQYMRDNGDASFINGKSIMFLAQDAYEKNSSQLAPTSDTSDAGTTPQSPRNIRLNTIGRFTWWQNGQSISWQVPDDVEDGFYQLAFRFRQELGDNSSFSYRNLYVNSKIPFEEARNIAFPFTTRWQVIHLAGGLPIRLQAGDIITLEATTGEAQHLLLQTHRTVRSLSAMYRQIIRVTTPNPDRFRDYNIQREIPTLVDDMRLLQQEVHGIAEELIRINHGQTSSQSVNLDLLADMLGRFAASPHILPENLQSFKTRLDSMASLIFWFNAQPLELDVGFILSADMPLPPARPGFFTRIWFGILRLYYSFRMDYRDITFIDDERESDAALRVWVSTGRDQAQIINRLITDDFTALTGIPVIVQQVLAGEPILQSIMSGRAPDVVLMQGPQQIINLAIRGAVMDLNRLGLNDEIRDRFFPSSWTEFSYRGRVYAIPETKGFNMMFYRRDILTDMGLEPPQTWDEFYRLLKILQGYNLSVGMPEMDAGQPGISAGIGYFHTFLFQRGGSIFNEDLTRTMFDTPVAMEAFEEWVDLYRLFGIEQDINFFNRMRSGETPLGITGITAYNMLAGAAPELAGLWDFAPIPGILREDGVIDRSTSVGGTGAIILSLAEERGLADEAFQFITWWTSAEIQSAYGLEIESMYGVVGRYYPANIEAFRRIGWTAAEEETIMAQWEWTQGIPLVPATYIIARNLTSALRLSVDDTYSPRRALNIFNRDINFEIERRRIEFDRIN